MSAHWQPDWLQRKHTSAPLLRQRGQRPYCVAADGLAQTRLWRFFTSHVISCTQVVKLWSTLGEQLGVIRATTSLLDSRRPGPVHTLAFHPYHLALASGGGDSLVNLYTIEASPLPDRAMSVPVR